MFFEPVVPVVRESGPDEVRDRAWTLSADRRRVDLEWVHRALSCDSYWAQGVSLEAVRTSLENSLLFGAYLDNDGHGQQVAFARVLTDGARVSYLADVYVEPRARGQGLGKSLVAFVFTHPVVERTRRMLLGTRDAHGLYERFGFVRSDVDRWMTRSW
jgi:GNAT superfamily N-acetyltransferase